MCPTNGDTKYDFKRIKKVELWVVLTRLVGWLIVFFVDFWSVWSVLLPVLNVLFVLGDGNSKSVFGVGGRGGSDGRKRGTAWRRIRQSSHQRQQLFGLGACRCLRPDFHQFVSLIFSCLKADADFESDPNLDPSFRCGLCSNVIVSAVSTPCCSANYCDKVCLFLLCLLVFVLCLLTVV